MKSDIRIPEHKCPQCGYLIDTTVEAYGDIGNLPNPGDVSMCISCGHAMLFNEDLTVREPTEKEALVINLMPEVMEAQLARSHLVGDKLKKRKR
jgi:Zn ribbon nucleic-acid-binding protein